MTSLPKIIELAREGGYKSPNLIGTHIGYFEGVLLDPEFYKALGKKLGWEEKRVTKIPEMTTQRVTRNGVIDVTYRAHERRMHRSNKHWLKNWHNLIDLIAEHGFENGVEIWAGNIIKEQRQ